MRIVTWASFAWLAACARLAVPAVESTYAREQLALARARPVVGPADEARVLRAATGALEPMALEARREVEAAGEAEGLLDLDAPGARDVVAKSRDPAGGAAFLVAAPLDLDTILLATYARNPDVEAARASWRSTIRLYEQATYLEDVLLRYRAFFRLSTPSVGSRAMKEAAFPYPGVVALKGEMIAAEVRMAREETRMRLRDALAAAAMAYVEAVGRTEEAVVRVELVGLADRMLATLRSRGAVGRGSQAEILQVEAERAMLENDRVQALAGAAQAKARLATLLALGTTEPIALRAAPDPPSATPALPPLLALAERFAPEARMARAERDRTVVAIRMAEAMLFAVPPPGAAAGLGMDRREGSMARGGEMPAPAGSSAGSTGGSMGRTMGGAGTPSPGGMPADGSLPSGVAGPPSTPEPAAPAALGVDLAWVAELRERSVALARKAEAAASKSARDVASAHFDLDAARRMHALTSSKTLPLARQAVEERLRRYEADASDFAEVFDAVRRVVEARVALVGARRMYGEAEARLWMAAGARPAVAGAGSGEGR